MFPCLEHLQTLLANAAQTCPCPEYLRARLCAAVSSSYRARAADRYLHALVARHLREHHLTLELLPEADRCQLRADAIEYILREVLADLLDPDIVPLASVAVRRYCPAWLAREAAVRTVSSDVLLRYLAHLRAGTVPVEVLQKRADQERWLAGFCRNRARDVTRAGCRASAQTQSLDLAGDLLPNPDSSAQRQQTRQELLELLLASAQDDIDRSLVEQRVLGRTLAECAQALGANMPFVAGRWTRLLERLRLKGTVWE